MSEWEIKCGAAILALYAALKLCHALGLDPVAMLRMVESETK